MRLLLSHRLDSPSFSALLELGILFLPGIPAYLWIWPNLQGSQIDIFQVIVYFYVLAGTLFIGLRRWNWSQLGLNRQGIGLTLACGIRSVIRIQLHYIIFAEFLTDARNAQHTMKGEP